MNEADEEKIKRDKIARKILKAVKKELNKGFEEYFSYAWREKISEMLLEESKYTKLVEWLNAEIEQALSTLNIFCPADRADGYTKNFFKTYLEQIQNLAAMIHMRELLLDERSTTQMRENIEYTIEKLYGAKYSEFLKSYV